jgi:hypothetical protein
LQFKNKLRLLTLAAIVAGILLGLFWAIPTAAKAPSQPNNDIIKNEEFIGPIPTEVTPRTRPINRPSIGANTSGDSGRYNGKTYTKEEVQQLIRDYSKAYGINPDVPLCIAKLESGYNQFSKNANSTASGVFQYLSSTWRGTDESKAGLGVFDADANVRAAIKYMASRQNTVPWIVNNRCPQL